MALFGCRCGNTLNDDNLEQRPFMASFVLWELQDDAWEGIAEHTAQKIREVLRAPDTLEPHYRRANGEVDWLALVFDKITALMSVQRDIMQCNECGRVWVQVPKNARNDQSFRAFIPEQQDEPSLHILSAQANE